MTICCFKIANDVSQRIYVVVIRSHSWQPAWIFRPLLEITPFVFNLVKKIERKIWYIMIDRSQEMENTNFSFFVIFPMFTFQKWP